MTLSETELDVLRSHLSCGFEQLDIAFAGCMEDAHHRLSAHGMQRYLEGASRICNVGRGFEPVLVYLETMPAIAEALGEDILDTIAKAVWDFSRTPNGQAILAFLQSIGTVTRRLDTLDQVNVYIKIVFDMMDATTVSIHGHHATIPSPGLIDMLNQMPFLLNRLSLEGLKNWSTYGSRHFLNNPDRQKDYFSVQSADSKAILARERHGTLYADVQRKLELYMKALWAEKVQFIPYSLGFDELRKPQPYFDHLGIHLPDVYDDFEGAKHRDTVLGIDRYRALLAHIAAHRRWSHAIFADNYSPFQRVTIEMFEDVRVEYLAMRLYGGMRALFKSLHPKPIEDDCNPDRESCIRHRLTMFSYAVLDAEHPYKNKDILEYVERFHQIMKKGESSTQAIAELAISFVARTRRQQDQSANMYFTNTEIDYRDDNRHLWKFYDLGDEEEMVPQNDKTKSEREDEEKSLPPRHYPEWDDLTKTYRPDWVSLYEGLHPPGNASEIDDILAKHAVLAKRLKQLLDRLKPQHYVRVRYQEDGAELDLDVAIRSLIDFRAGVTPDPRINMSHRTDGRNIAVSLLLDLSQSVAQTAQGCDQSILEIAREAVSLLGWSIDRLGDEFAIAGFSSNTRHEVRYQHIKGYGESWGEAVKGRLAAIEAGYSTRMGAAIRHAGDRLAQRHADKKLLLVLTDGEPSDIDVDDENHLIKDAHKAVMELDQKGIYTHCINLDSKADGYVGDVFGNRYCVIDNVARLPEKLPQLFVALTK